MRRPRSDFAIPKKINFGLGAVTIRWVTKAQMCEAYECDGHEPGEPDVCADAGWFPATYEILLGSWLTGPALRRAYFHELHHLVTDLEWESH
jgi:hypothetical protein